MNGIIRLIFLTYDFFFFSEKSIRTRVPLPLKGSPSFRGTVSCISKLRSPLKVRINRGYSKLGRCHVLFQFFNALDPVSPSRVKIGLRLTLIFFCLRIILNDENESWSLLNRANYFKKLITSFDLR